LDELNVGCWVGAHGRRKSPMRRDLRLLVFGGVLLTFLVQASTMAAASTWAIAIGAASRAEAQAQGAPATPTGVTATCTSSIQTTVNISWSAVIHATTYTVYVSTTSSTTGFSSLATGIVGTSWTSAPLATGNYWFEAAAYEGSQWASANSSATVQRTITVLLCA
jgi:hypothetical protein